MTDQRKEPTLDGADSVPEMPPTDDTGGMREKGGKKSNKIILIGFGAIVVVMGYVMFVPRGEQAPEAPTANSGGQAFIEGGASIDSDGVRQEQRGSEDGGVGRERAEVLSEIQEREEVLERIERGETAVIFGDAEILSEEEENPEPVAPAPIFGDVTPREVPEQQQVAAPGNSAITNTPPAIRPRPAVQPQGAPQQNSGIDQNRLQYELDRMTNGLGTGHANVSYTQHQASQNQHRHTLTPTLDASSEQEVPTTKTGQLAMPGDTSVAYLNNRISSDQPDGVVQADILSGELRGARLLGQADFQGERLLVRFSQMVFEDEIYSINALAVDPDTMESSVADGINRRLFTRYGVPILAGIASIGIDYQAERANPSVTVVNQDTGERVTRRTNQAGSFGEFALGETSDSLKRPLGDIAQNAANTPKHVWANPGAIGILFVQPIPQ